MPRKIARYGWIPDQPDQRDHLYAAPALFLAALPPSADLRRRCPAVYNQGQLGSCTAQANENCQIQCQSSSYAQCKSQYEQTCTTQCSQEGALFCNGSYVDVGGNLTACVDALNAIATNDLQD